MTTSVTLAAAQCTSAWSDVSANVAAHVALAVAAGDDVDFLIFPELSLTGYPGTIAPPVIGLDDSRLSPLREAALAHDMTLVAGAPIPGHGSKPHIGALIFTPDGMVRGQSKTLLHSGEEHLFDPGVGGPPLRIKDLTVAISICAESNHESHLEAAAAAGADVYAISALLGRAAYSAADDQIRHWSDRFDLAVILSNHCGQAGNYVGAGQSALWLPSAGKVASAPAQNHAVLCARLDAKGWHPHIVTGPGTPGGNMGDWPESDLHWDCSTRNRPASR